jgi:hypothetical protein
MFAEPVLRVVVKFCRNANNKLEGEIHTLLPNTMYQFSVYEVNKMNYNIPSPYSQPVTTMTLTEKSYIFKASYFKSRDKTKVENGFFKRCGIELDYNTRKYIL